MADLTERVAWAIVEHLYGDTMWDHLDSAERRDYETTADATLAAVADAPGLAEVLRAHRTSLVTCAGKIAGAACSCDWQTDHGWLPEGAQKRADDHLVAVVRAWLRGEGT